MSDSKHQNQKGNTRNIRELILSTLEQHDGSCLDNADEREALSKALEAQLSQYRAKD